MEYLGGEPDVPQEQEGVLEHDGREAPGRKARSWGALFSGLSRSSLSSEFSVLHVACNLNRFHEAVLELRRGHSRTADFLSLKEEAAMEEEKEKQNVK